MRDSCHYDYCCDERCVELNPNLCEEDCCDDSASFLIIIQGRQGHDSCGRAQKEAGKAVKTWSHQAHGPKRQSKP